MSGLDEVVDELFGTFQRQFPLTSGKTHSKKIIDQKLDQFYAEAHLVRKKHRLWIVGWARVVLKFQQRLLLSGHSPEAVKPLLLGMIIFSYNAK